MTMNKILMSTFILCLAILLSSCGEEDLSGGPNDIVMDMIPSDKTESGAGIFTSFAHGLSGRAILFCGNGDSKSIRLEDFNMTAGPDVYVFVSKSNNYSKANVIEVTKLTSGYTDSDINFEFTSSNYSSEYKFVLVYCLQYNSLFGYAELQ